ADMPKEDVSVVEVDVFDGKSLCEEDKAVLPLKKDNSGIGGSVSDSDEGDSGQTTASTVHGYKGQTPNHQPPVFARSESTQPLLDCEEHPDHLNESGGQARNSYFRRGRELEQGLVLLLSVRRRGSARLCLKLHAAAERLPTSVTFIRMLAYLTVP
ncbi:hypothetical protein M9458_021299, partial [Cirrhinus mrigala]